MYSKVALSPRQLHGWATKMALSIAAALIRVRRWVNHPLSDPRAETDFHVFFGWSQSKWKRTIGQVCEHLEAGLVQLRTAPISNGRADKNYPMHERNLGPELLLASGNQKKNSRQQKTQPCQASQLGSGGPSLFGDNKGRETDDPGNIHYAANK